VYSKAVTGAAGASGILAAGFAPAWYAIAAFVLVMAFRAGFKLLPRRSR
jgi:hypothetical protein